VVKQQKKLGAANIITVGDLNNIDLAIKQQLEQQPRLPLKNLMEQGALCIDGDAPEVTDYRKAANPYEARYGDDWVLKIRETNFMSAYVCVTELVEWIVESTKKMFQGTTHEDDWVFYHDALSQLTANETVIWMKAKGYYDRWIHPLNKLHQDQPDLKAYYNRPVGDRPENMPWDNTLNQDVHVSVNQHVLFTSKYEEDDERKFSLSTPNRASYAYRRILHPVTGVVPSSDRIIHDVELVFESLMKIHHAKGIKDTTLANRSGNRWEKSPIERRGGRREKNKWKDMVLHPHAVQGRKIKMELSRERFEGLGDDREDQTDEE
jgi:hypothetical protein